METNKIENMNKGELMKVDLYSRRNTINKKYSMAKLGLDDLSSIKDSNTFFLETLIMKANLADRMIAEAESKGEDTSDPIVMKELGEKINAIGTPLHRSEAAMTGIFNSLGLMLYWGIAVGIWGIIFNKSFLIFGLCGAVVGFVISVLFGGVVALQRTKEKTREMSFMIGYLWGNLAIAVGIIGLVILIIKLLFLTK